MSGIILWSDAISVSVSDLGDTGHSITTISPYTQGPGLVNHDPPGPRLVLKINYDHY